MIDDIAAMGHLIHMVFVLEYGFRGRRIMWIYFRLTKSKRQPQAVVENFERICFWNGLSDPLS